MHKNAQVSLIPKARALRVLVGATSALIALLLAPATDVRAWSQEGHMLTGAIVYEELKARDPRLVDEVLDLMAQHPDRGTFEVAAGHAGGESRSLRIFMEMARWSDDIRRGAYDHPTWHYASKPLVDARHPPKLPPRESSAGSALEALTLNLSVLRDPRAPSAERALALCWLFHLVGDIHQPLHAADEYSTNYPNGDKGGNLQFVRDPQTQQNVSLHAYWDGAVNRDIDQVAVHAAELRTEFPRGKFAELGRGPADDFAGWQSESFNLAKSQVYRADLVTSGSESSAPLLAAGYVSNATQVASARLTLSAYRLADLIASALRD
jgi:hypothetical protein